MYVVFGEIQRQVKIEFNSLGSDANDTLAIGDA